MTLLFRARPTTYRLKARLTGRFIPLAGAAKERVELAPGSTVASFEAVALPDEELRATGTMSSSNLAAEMKNVKRGVGVHGPTIAYLHEDALVADACCYAGGRYENLRPQKRRHFVDDRIEELDEAQLCTDMGAELYFGHWLCDGLSKELLAAERGIRALSLDGTNRPHEAGYRELLSLPSHAVSTARVRRLWVIDDLGYNAQRVQRFLTLRARLRAGAVAKPHDMVFVDRGASGSARLLINRDAVIGALTARGATVITPESMTPRAVADALCGARLVIGVEGSHLNHALLALPTGAGILAIQPPDRFNMFNKTIAEFASLKFGFIVAEARPGGFHVDLERLNRTIDLFERHA